MTKAARGKIEEFRDKPDLYQAIGKFVYQFSQLEFAIRHLLSDLLELTPSQFHIVTTSYDFATLCRVTSAFICDLPEARAEGDLKKSVRGIFNDCLKVNDARVRLVHGTWEESGASHVSRTTLEPTAYFQSKSEIANSIEQAKVCLGEIVKLIDGEVVSWARDLRGDVRKLYEEDCSEGGYDGGVR